MPLQQDDLETSHCRIPSGTCAGDSTADYHDIELIRLACSKIALSIDIHAETELGGGFIFL
jgi:hypothetical protein